MPGSAGRIDLAGSSADQVALLAAVGRTTLFTSAALPNAGGRYLVVCLLPTVIGAASLTLTISGLDPGSGTFYPILTSAAITTNVMRVLRVGPNVTPAANLAAADILPGTLQISVAVADANPATYTLGYVLG